MEHVFESIVGLIALTLMEIVLGIDNIIFIAILTDRLPEEQQDRARRLGLAGAMIMRVGLLLMLTAIMGLTEPLFYLTDLQVPLAWLPTDRQEEINAISWRDVIMLVGGLFLIVQSVREIHEQFEGEDHPEVARLKSFKAVLAQILAFDVIFSLDSVITAVGMVEPDQLWVMVTAIILAVGVMLLFAGRVSGFVKRNPTIKILALSFLIMIGIMLVAEGIGTHIDKGYVYFAMAFSLFVEMVNLGLRRKRKVPSEDT